MTWNGSAVTGPVLIYHDELLLDLEPSSAPLNETGINVPGALVCRSEDAETGRASWRLTDGRFFHDTTQRSGENLQQRRTESGDFPSLSRLSRGVESFEETDPQFNGLWICRTEHSDEHQFIHVGLYNRGG